MEGKAAVTTSTEHGDGEASKTAARTVVSGSSRGGAASRALSVADLILRVVAVVAIVDSAIAMGTTNQTLPFFTQFLRFKAQYSDLPTLTLFAVANSAVTAYLVLSIPLSVVHIIRSRASYSRLVLIFLDSVMLALVAAVASASAAIVYLAHKGNVRANWFAVCQQFDSFCERISGPLIGSFAAMAVLLLLVLLSAAALARR
ncbi:casparian strip membrane protein 4 [Oryza glaberrima]|uniref:CASP-like protein n=1 Tax=Oryza glaberrima TaxID=4538 RepID=I1P471_ORYGL|nr:casparian strip membrane protein 4 [Oryza glaberrima]